MTLENISGSMVNSGAMHTHIESHALCERHLIRLKRIYNFLCSMLVLHQLSNVLPMLWYTFYAFSHCIGINTLSTAVNEFIVSIPKEGGQSIKI